MAELHTCPACNGEPAKPMLAHFNTGLDSSKHYFREIVMPCRVCDGAGTVTPHVLVRYFMGRKHREERVARNEALFHAAKRLGVSSAQLSAYEHGYADLPPPPQEGSK